MAEPAQEPEETAAEARPATDGHEPSSGEPGPPSGDHAPASAEEPAPSEGGEPPAGQTTSERRRVATKALTRSAQIILLLLVINNLVLPQLGGAERAINLVSDVNPWLLVLAVTLQLSSLAAYSLMTRATLPADQRLAFPTLLRIQLATKSVTHLVPGGSAAGTAAGFRLLTNAGVSGSAAGFTLATVGLGSAVVLNVILWVALLISIPLNGFDPLYGTAALIGAALLAAFAGIIVLFMRGETLADRVVRAVARRIPLLKEDAAARVVADIAEHLRELASDRVILRRSILWASANWLLDAASLFVFVRAFGAWVNPIDLLVAFGLARLLAVIPITPGGLGVVEATLISTLVGFGLDRGVAAISVVTYRLVEFWLPIPLGALAYGSLKVGPAKLRGSHPIRNLRGESADMAGVRQWDYEHERK